MTATVRLLALCVVLAVLCALLDTGAVFAQAPTPVASPSVAESWVQSEVAAGRVADLSERFQSEPERRLSAQFFERMLTSPAPHQGIRLAGAVFDEPLELRNLVVEHETWCVSCRFSAPVDLSESRFRNGLELAASRFLTATFQAIQVEGDLGLRATQFAGTADLSQAEVSRSLTLNGARFRMLHLSGAHVAANLFSIGAVFDGRVDMIGTRIGGDLLMSGARFNDEEMALAMSAARIGGIAGWREAEFSGAVDASYLDVGLDLEIVGARFQAAATFSTMKVGGYMSLSRTVFDAPAYFVSTEVAHDLYADQAHFGASEGTTDFSALQVGGSALFTDSLFEGGASFSDARIGGDFAGYGGRFVSTANPVSFRAIRVAGQLMLDQATFAGPVEFIRAEVSLGFEAEQATFLNENERIDFSDMTVDGFAFIVGAVFSGTTTFGEAEIKGDFFADEVAFVNPNASASFLGMTVGGTAYMRNATFLGGALFSRTDIGGQLVMDGTRFLNPDRMVLMTGMRVGDSFYLHNAQFAGSLEASDSTFMDLAVGGNEEDTVTLPVLSLARSTIGRDLTIEHAAIDHLLLPALRVSGPASLRAVTVARSADLQQAQFASLNLDNVSWIADRKSLRLDGLGYGHLSAGLEHDSWLTLLRWVDGGAYSANVYRTMETYFAQLGYPEQADVVYVAQKRRERAEVLGGPGRLDWWWSLFLDVFVRFGRSPGRAFAWSALIVAFGCLVFRRRAMEPSNPDARCMPYNTFWHSLDVFVPVLDLGSATRWVPRAECRVARHYTRLHAILGWLLIPIGLAALTGIIK